MTGFRRGAQGAACLSGARLEDLLRKAGVPTPAYFYDLDGLTAEARALEDAFGTARHLVAYAVKANSAGSILRRLASQGLGADVVSGAELELALAVGIPADRILMAGVAKSDWELDLAVGSGIRAVVLESVEEIGRVAARARALGRIARVSLRLNPGIEIDSHAHIATGHDEAKFGIALADVPRAWELIDDARDALSGVGCGAHIGSMQASTTDYLAAAGVICDVARARSDAGGGLEFVDFGGGFAIDYGDGPPTRPADFVKSALSVLESRGLAELAIVIEPGRSLVGPFGVLVAKVVQGKASGERRWAMIDAGMNDLIRPALYGAKHRIEPLDREPSAPEYRVVGPVCESSDDFGSHPLGAPLPELVAIRDAGAYGFVMSSEYNGRPLPAEVFVSSGQIVSVSPGSARARWIEGRLKA